MHTNLQVDKRETPMKVPDPLIKEFYRAVASWGFAGSRARKGYECLVRIGAASGFYSEYEFKIAERGACVVAIEDTPEAATALAMYILLAQGWDSIAEAGNILRMTTPAAASALDELVNKVWDKYARDDFVKYRQRYDELAGRRRQPITRVFIDARNLSNASGYRIGRTVSSAYWGGAYGSYIPNDGWIKLDGSLTPGIDPELEANTGELVFNSTQEAYRYAEQRGWTVVNALEL